MLIIQSLANRVGVYVVSDPLGYHLDSYSPHDHLQIWFAWEVQESTDNHKESQS